MDEDFIPCTLKQLPQEQWVGAAKTAVDINPANSPPLQQLSQFAAISAIANPLSPQHISVLVSKWWQSGGVKLGVSFMDSPPQDVRNRILKYLNLWNAKGANIHFMESASGEVRLDRGPTGYWSYLGTDILSIPQGEPTMNLQGITMQTPDAECLRVIPHEAFHTCGGPHEHMRPDLVARIDPAKAIAYFGATQGWSARDVYQQVLTPLSERSLYATAADQDSCMCYQLPGSITYDGLPIRGGNHINDNDYTFAAKMYPGVAVEPPPVTPPVSMEKWVALVLKVIAALRKLLEKKTLSAASRRSAMTLLEELESHANA